MIEDDINDKASDIFAIILIVLGIIAGVFIFITFFCNDISSGSNEPTEYIIKDIFDCEYTISANGVKEIYLENTPEEYKKYIVFYIDDDIVYTVESTHIRSIKSKE